MCVSNHEFVECLDSCAQSSSLYETYWRAVRFGVPRPTQIMSQTRRHRERELELSAHGFLGSLSSRNRNIFEVKREKRRRWGREW